MKKRKKTLVVDEEPEAAERPTESGAEESETDLADWMAEAKVQLKEAVEVVRGGLRKIGEILVRWEPRVGQAGVDKLIRYLSGLSQVDKVVFLNWYRVAGNDLPEAILTDTGLAHGVVNHMAKDVAENLLTTTHRVWDEDSDVFVDKKLEDFDRRQLKYVTPQGVASDQAEPKPRYRHYTPHIELCDDGESVLLTFPPVSVKAKISITTLRRYVSEADDFRRAKTAKSPDSAVA